jgi:probable HAF family extracellular repeat protein
MSAFTTTRDHRSSASLAAQLVAAAVAATVVCAAPAPAATTTTPSDIRAASTFTYRVDDLGVLPGDGGSVATGINASGQVVGWSSEGAGTRAFLYTDGPGMQLLPAPAGRPRAVARAVNDAGVVVGSANTGGTDLGHAVRWTGGVAADLGTLGVGPYSEAYAINAAGAAVGYSYTEGAHLDGTHGFMHTTAAGMTDLTPGGAAEAHGVNTSGQVTGWQNGQAFRWQDGVLTELPVPTGFEQSFGFAINDAGQVAGSTVSASGNTQRPFRWTPGEGSVVLGGIGESNTALGINSRGDVVGTGRAVTGPVRAFLSTDQAGMVDLNSLIDPASGWVLMGATGINDAGQIAAYGFNNLTGGDHALRLTPTATRVDTTPPTVRFRHPRPGTVVSGWTGINVVADDDVALASIRVFIDGALICRSTLSPLRCRWNAAGASGVRHLRAVAVDTSRNQQTTRINLTAAGG